MQIENAMKKFGLAATDIKDITQSKNLLVTELKLQNDLTLQVNTLTNKAKLITK